MFLMRISFRSFHRRSSLHNENACAAMRTQSSYWTGLLEIWLLSGAKIPKNIFSTLKYHELIWKYVFVLVRSCQTVNRITTEARQYSVFEMNKIVKMKLTKDTEKRTQDLERNEAAKKWMKKNDSESILLFW